MLFSIFLSICLYFSLIFNGYAENIFIILATLLFYKIVLVEKEYKIILPSLIICFIGINMLCISGFRDHIKIKEVQTLEREEETVVLLVSEGEAKNYNIVERCTEIYYDKGVSAYFTAIKDLYEYQSYYDKFGSSDFKEEAENIATKLRNKLGKDYKVVNTYMYSKPYFEKGIEDIISNGYKNIIICPMFMTDGVDYETFIKRYEKLKLSTYGMDEIKILDTFYQSNNLAMMYKDEILKDINSFGYDAGILLIGLENENNIEQDILFREKIKNYIVLEQKNNDIQIKLPLLENNKKDIIKAGEELLEYGIDSLYIVLPTFVIDNMYTKHLVESILEELNLGETKFYYVDPKTKENVIADEIYTKVKLSNEIGG